ncbi:hypothetical protein B296_00002710 [Ensete ventricosum]|uniref:Uncharacterized protein n=1 Tax=Ensete ventricosum TaxID=4639 RepID=A0A427ARD3_ENSVE|nr:hypothetical protein B296_00002710 [Ensete ventricosum]
MAGLLQTVAAKWTTTADDEPSEACQKIRLDDAMTTADGELEEGFVRGRTKEPLVLPNLMVAMPWGGYCRSKGPGMPGIP